MGEYLLSLIDSAYFHGAYIFLREIDTTPTYPTMGLIFQVFPHTTRLTNTPSIPHTIHIWFMAFEVSYLALLYIHYG